MVESEKEELLKLQPEMMEMVLSADLLHKRLGLLGEVAMLKIIRGGLVDGIDGGKKGGVGMCHFCKLRNLAAHPHPTVPIQEHGSQQVALEMVGQDKPMILGGKTYDTVFVDTFSRKSWVVLLARESDVAAILMTWIPLMETRSGKKLQTLKPDKGGEFGSNVLRDLMKKRGSPANTLQSNERAVRINRTL